jgi:class 3 adenylate cyclase/tetratricopeptide (TPR) repeat protein
MSRVKPSSSATGHSIRLEMNCPRCGVKCRPAAKYCDECGLPFGSRLSPERRPLTVLFCDMVDSTSLVQEIVDPDELRAMFTPFLKATIDAVTSFGGHVARIVGDAVQVYFGYPNAQEDDPERSLHAALAVMEGMARLRDRAGRPIQARIGIATGWVVVGNLHRDMTPQLQDVAGEPPHLAARLQGLATPGSIVVASETKRLVGALFSWRPLGPVALKGYSNLIDAWELVKAQPAASRYDAMHDAGVFPMIGRDDVRTVLVEQWRRSLHGSGGVVLVTGEAGIGKSRLAAALLEETLEKTTLRYFCSPFRQGSPLHPFIQQMEWAAGIDREDGAEAKLRKLEGVLRDASAEEVGLLAELINIPAGARFPISTLSPQVKRRRTMEALLAQLMRLAGNQPTLVIFEDAQWSDRTSRDLLELAIEKVLHLPVLLLVLARPDFVPDWKDQAHVSRIELTPLLPADGALLANLVAEGAPLSTHIVSGIVDRAGGNPLFIEELTKAVLESKQWSEVALSRPRGEGSMPILLQALLLSRLDRLGESREVAETAAAIGRHFSRNLLELVIDRPERVSGALEALAAEGIVQPLSGKPSEYVFRHALIRDAAYDTMLKERSRPIHARIVEAMESHFPEMISQQPEVIARHCKEGGRPKEAGQYWLKASHTALRRSAMNEALLHARAGIEAIGDAGDGPWRAVLELDLHISLGKAQIATQGYAVPSTGATFVRAHELCATLGHAPQLLAVQHGLWTHALMRADLHSAKHQARELLLRGQERDDRMSLLMGYRFCGVTSHPCGEFTAATRFLESGLQLYDPSQQSTYWALTVDDPRVIMLTYLSWSQMCLGQIASARSNSERAITEANEMAHGYTLAHALTGASFVAMTIDTPAAALIRLDALRALLVDNAIDYYDAVETVLRGWCVAAIGDHAAAAAHLESGLSAYRKTDARLYLSGFLRLAAEAYGRMGRVARALELIGESRNVLEATNQRWDEAETFRVHGVLLRLKGDPVAARREFDRALEVARRQEAHLWELRAACELTELALDGGSAVPERVLLANAIDAYGANTCMPDLDRAREIAARPGRRT